MRWLNYQHLFYFWNVARLGSVSRAAAYLRLAQPTVSAQISGFEEWLGVKLLERSGRGLILTATGHAAFKYAERIFTLGSEMLELLEDSESGSNAELRIGISDVMPKTMAYHLIEPALESSGKGLVSCFEAHTERLLAALAIGELDLVLADRPVPPNVKVKAFNHLIGECGVAFLAAPALARKHRSGFPASLARAPLLMPTSDAVLRQELEQWFDKQGIVPRPVAAFQDRALMKLAARQSRGIVPVPLLLEKEVRKEHKLETVGRTEGVRERVFLISTERRINNPLIAKIRIEGQAFFTS